MNGIFVKEAWRRIAPWLLPIVLIAEIVLVYGLVWLGGFLASFTVLPHVAMAA